MAPSSKPVFVIVPGGAQTPSHYGYLEHLLMSQGYGALSALLPTVGTSAPVTAQEDADFIRSRMLLPVLDIEKHDVIIISHSYSLLQNNRILPANITSIIPLLNFSIRTIKIYYINI